MPNTLYQVTRERLALRIELNCLRCEIMCVYAHVVPYFARFVSLGTRATRRQTWRSEAAAPSKRGQRFVWPQGNRRRLENQRNNARGLDDRQVRDAGHNADRVSPFAGPASRKRSQVTGCIFPQIALRACFARAPVCTRSDGLWFAPWPPPVYISSLLPSTA